LVKIRQKFKAQAFDEQMRSRILTDAGVRCHAHAGKLEHFNKQYKKHFVYNTLQLTKSKIFIEAHDL
jgi:hypothetical protein